ncbi:MAG TPA: GNAT family N-acetyltransferase [Pseudolabrys sp.]|nr:GNAT family N-acetyltransferase [Pseudolabrys sp.]HKU17890.1 GNAT family N-acetyltransferase [Candidatus Saccharimonadales bacterium]
MEIRDATNEDAEAACQVVRQSITDLCTADHQGDAAVLDLWLRNKTPETFKIWIAHQANSVLVAIQEGVIVGVAAVNDGGEITLNYVSPNARFRGVSRALLRAVEDRARQRGNLRCTLTSTETARRFYLANGYVEHRSSTGKFSVSGYPMSKALTV